MTTTSGQSIFNLLITSHFSDVKKLTLLNVRPWLKEVVATQASSTAQLQLQRVSCYKCSVGVELNKTVHSWVGIKLQPSDQHQADSNMIPTSL